MKSEIERRFLKIRVAETRCPEVIRQLGVMRESIYVLRERIDCSHWDAVREHFLEVAGNWIVKEPVAGRKRFTLEPRKVVRAMKKRGIW